MASITLKDLPKALHRDLKARAKAHHRSLNKEVIATLQSSTSTATAHDAESMIREAKEMRRFKRVLRTSEISSWKKSGRL